MNPLIILSICAVICTGVFVCAALKLYKTDKEKLLVSQEGFQLEKDKLLISLNQVFFNEPEFQKLLDNIDRGDGLTADDLRIASRCLDYFEPFYHLIQRRCLSIEQVDDMFAFRFFAVTNDQDVQDELIGPHCDYYNNIVNLYFIWHNYRKDNGKSTMYEKTEMANKEWYKEMTGLKS